MRLILDTHCWLWWIAEPDRLSPQALEAIASPNNTILFSAVSSWEIAIKHRLGRISLPEAPERFVLSRISRDHFEPLAVTHLHALGVARLPLHHRDPFDRLLISQAITEAATLVTSDTQIRRYDIDVLGV